MASFELNRPFGRFPRSLDRLRPVTRDWLLFSALGVLTAAFLYRETRGTTFWFDDWNWILYRRGHSVGTFLRPYNQHLSLVPIALFKLLYSTVGIDNFAPYRAIVIAGHVGCSALLFAYARRRVGGYLALIAAGLFLLLGPGWQVSLWPINIAWIVAVAGGIGALLLLDRGGRPAEAAACVLMALGLAGTTVGLAIAAGLLVEVLGGRDRRRRAWIVLIPLVLYAVWAIAYETSGFHRHNIVLTPPWLVESAAGSLGSMLGLGGDPVFQSPTTPLIYGVPLLVAAVAAAGWRLLRLGGPWLRLVSLTTMALAFWTLTGLTRAGVGLAFGSRYLYVSAALILLITVELMRGTRVHGGAKIVLTIVAAAVVVSNLGAFRDGARFLRDQARLTTSDLEALDLSRPVISPGYMATRLPGSPLVPARAGAYFSAEKAYGTPAVSALALPAQPEFVREAVDSEFASAHRVGLAAVSPGLARGLAPRTDAASGGTARTSGSCTTFTPAGFSSSSAPATLDFKLPAAGVVLKTSGGAATVSVRRYADAFPATPQARMGDSAAALLRISPDLSRQPWHVRVSPSARVIVCGLG